MRTPDQDGTNDTPGELECKFEVWFEPSDISWEDIVDTDLHGKTPPPGTEIWDVCVRASYLIEREGQTFTFEGCDSLGGITVDPSCMGYLKECAQEVKRVAYAALLKDIEMVASGRQVQIARNEQDAARSIGLAECEPIEIPLDFPVQPLKMGQAAGDPGTCGTCGLSWDDSIATGYTPAPGGRCPFEEFHR